MPADSRRSPRKVWTGRRRKRPEGVSLGHFERRDAAEADRLADGRTTHVGGTLYAPDRFAAGVEVRNRFAEDVDLRKGTPFDLS